jgi:DNA invertase Pin-like site-specific DNA recombinase
MLIGYARVSTTHQDLARQLDALAKAGVDESRTFVDKKSGSTMARDGWEALISYAREGDTIVVYTLDRVGRSVLSVLQVIADLRARGIGIKTLADPIPVDTTAEGGPMAELAIVLLTLFAQMELTYNRERAAHARAVAESQGRQVGRPSVVDPKVLQYAVHLRDTGSTMSEIVAATKLSRATLYRHHPPRPEVAPTASGIQATR